MARNANRRHTAITEKTVIERCDNRHSGWTEDSPGYAMSLKFARPDGTMEPIVTVDAAQLQPVTLSILPLEAAHEGHYLLLRTLSWPFKHMGLYLAAEDTQGARVCLDMYQFTNLRRRDELNKLLPKHTILLIKHPFFRLHSKDYYAISCHNRENITLLPPWDPLLVNTPWYKPNSKPPPAAEPLSSKGWQDLGNSRFKEKDFYGAIDAYGHGLALDPANAALVGNRAQAWLQLHSYFRALADAEAALSCDPNSAKAMYRKGRALVGLSRHSEALLCFQAALDTGQGGADVSKMLQRCRRWVRESRGEFDWGALEQARRKPTSKENELDCATFVSPQVEVQDVPGKGKGIIALAGIPAGTLIMAEKAVVIAWPAQWDVPEGVPKDKWRRVVLADLICEELRGNEALREEMFQLSRGGHTYPDDPPRLSGDVELSEAEQRMIDAIAAMNDFRVGSGGASPSPSMDGCGLWLRHSRFNHSCVPNCEQDNVQDVKFTRVMRDVRAGEELTMSYTDNTVPVATRHTKLQYRGFQCACRLCKAQAAAGPDLDTLHDTLQGLKQQIPIWTTLPPRLTDMLLQSLPLLCEKAMSLYDPSVNVTACECQFTAGDIFYKAKQYKEFLTHSEKAFNLAVAHPDVACAIGPVKLAGYALGICRMLDMEGRAGGAIGRRAILQSQWKERARDMYRRGYGNRSRPEFNRECDAFKL